MKEDDFESMISSQKTKVLTLSTFDENELGYEQEPINSETFHPIERKRDSIDSLLAEGPKKSNTQLLVDFLREGPPPVQPQQKKSFFNWTAKRGKKKDESKQRASNGFVSSPTTPKQQNYGYVAPKANSEDTLYDSQHQRGVTFASQLEQAQYPDTLQSSKRDSTASLSDYYDSYADESTYEPMSTIEEQGKPHFGSRGSSLKNLETSKPGEEIPMVLPPYSSTNQTFKQPHSPPPQSPLYSPKPVQIPTGLRSPVTSPVSQKPLSPIISHNLLSPIGSPSERRDPRMDFRADLRASDRNRADATDKRHRTPEPHDYARIADSKLNAHIERFPEPGMVLRDFGMEDDIVLNHRFQPISRSNSLQDKRVDRAPKVQFQSLDDQLSELTEIPQLFYGVSRHPSQKADIVVENKRSSVVTRETSCQTEKEEDYKAQIEQLKKELEQTKSENKKMRELMAEQKRGFDKLSAQAYKKIKELLTDRNIMSIEIRSLRDQMDQMELQYQDWANVDELEQ